MKKGWPATTVNRPGFPGGSGYWETASKAGSHSGSSIFLVDGYNLQVILYYAESGRKGQGSGMPEAESTEWTVEWYRTAAGEIPAKTFLARLTGRPKDEALALLEVAQRRGNRMREPKSQ